MAQRPSFQMVASGRRSSMAAVGSVGKGWCVGYRRLSQASTVEKTEKQVCGRGGEEALPSLASAGGDSERRMARPSTTSQTTRSSGHSRARLSRSRTTPKAAHNRRRLRSATRTGAAASPTLLLKHAQSLLPVSPENAVLPDRNKWYAFSHNSCFQPLTSSLPQATTSTAPEEPQTFT